MQTNILSLQPINYYTIKEELCFFIGGKVASKYAEHVDALREELLHTDCLTICNHVKREGSEFYILMTHNHLIYADRSSENNFQINRIDSGREFQSRKKYLYNQGVFLIIANNGVSVVLRQEKRTSCSQHYNNWGMTPTGMNDLCNAIDDYFSGGKNKSENKVDLKFDKQVLQPLKNFTYYEDLAEQLEAYGNNSIDYDYYEFVSGRAKSKVYDFVSASFDPDTELFQVGDRVAVETNEAINDEINRKLKGTIIDRILEEDSVRIQIEFIEQFDNSLLVLKHGRIFPQANETQKRVRQNVIRNIVNGTVDSKYMYQLFSSYKTAGFEEVDGWEEFHEELMKKKYPPNKSQMEAIRRGIETKDIQLVLGPPGTGKTTVIVAWIEFFIKHGKRVLVSSQNNSAVDNVLERVGKNPSARIIRLGNISKIQENCKDYATERQVDKTATRYIQKLDESKSILSGDINRITQMIALIDSVANDYQKLEEYYALFDKYQGLFKQLTDTMIASNGQATQQYQLYEAAYAQRIHKDVYMFAIAKKSDLYKFFHAPITRKVKSDLQILYKRVDEAAKQYISSLMQYNDASDAFQHALNDAEYVEMKNNITALTEKCSNNSFDIDLQGPFKVEGIEISCDKENIVGTYEKLMEYKERLASVYQKLRGVNDTLDDWKISINGKRNEIVTELLIQNSNVVGATCIGINTRPQFRNLQFDVSIIDESGQIQVHNAIVPMSRAPKTLMLGDHLQIPPMANDVVVSLCKQDGIKTDLLEMSFFEYLFTRMENRDANTPNLTRLDEQFRMPGNISDVISDWFYGGNYHAHYDMSTWRPVVRGTNSPLILISTSNEKRRFETAENGGGYSNMLEAEVAAKIVSMIGNDAFEENKEGGLSPTVGIISGYGKQVRLVRQKIKEEKLGFKPEQIYSIAASLDSFQGQERPLIIYSSTRSNDPGKVSPRRARVGFLKELRRLNVAFTRCQKQLVIIGDFDYLTSCEYEEIDSETGMPIPNKSEKKYAEFMQKMVDQAKCGNGEFYYLDEFLKRVEL